MLDARNDCTHGEGRFQPSGRVPGFVGRVSVNYPNPASASKTFVVPLSAGYREVKEIVVVVGFGSAEVTFTTGAPEAGQRTAPMNAAPATISTPATTRRRPITSVDRPRRSADSATAQSDCVAFSGATTDTRPRSKASKSRP
jgi:hypothetical protein